MNMMTMPDVMAALSRQKASVEEKPHEAFFVQKEKKTETPREGDFARTLERVVSQESPKKREKTEQSQATTMADLKKQVDNLLDHPELQTDEAVAKILAALLSFLQGSGSSLAAQDKKELSQFLASLKEMVALWEKGKMTTQDLLHSLKGWFQDLEKIQNLGQGFQVATQMTAEGQKETASDTRTVVTSRDGREITSAGDVSSSARSSIRVIDKRSPEVGRKETAPQTPSPMKEGWAAKIESLIKEIEGREGMPLPSPKGIQDFGVKTTPALPSLPRVSVEQMLQQVAGKALITLRDGQSEMRLQLTPPDLGRMEMKIVLEDGQMQGKIVVSTPEAKQLFDQNLGELQRQLQQAGVQVGNLDVSLGQPGGEKPEPHFSGSVDGYGGGQEVPGEEEPRGAILWADRQVNYIV